MYISRGIGDIGNSLLSSGIIEDSSSSYCKYCFSSIAKFISAPLDWRKFDLFREWYLEVPLELQIILFNIFINRKSLCKTEISNSYVQSKLPKLYALLELGLLIYNKNYYGINQRLNTEELIVNYHAVSTVFSITAQCGATHSQKFANNWLQQRADTDQIFYETFLKKYSICYQARGEDHES